MRGVPAAIALAAAMAATTAGTATEAGATPIEPIVFGSVRDSPPDGIGDSIPTFVPGVIDRVNAPPATVPRETRAIVEFPLAGLEPDRRFRISGRVFANNFLDTGPRVIALALFEGDGALGLDDFSAPALRVGEVTYAPPADRSVAFDLDVTGPVRALLADGAGFLGLRFDPLTLQAPSRLVESAPPRLTATVPLPATAWSLAAALAAAAGLARRRSRPRGDGSAGPGAQKSSRRFGW